jgi:hypothetical protein
MPIGGPGGRGGLGVATAGINLDELKVVTSLNPCASAREVRALEQLDQVAHCGHSHPASGIELLVRALRAAIALAVQVSAINSNAPVPGRSTLRRGSRRAHLPDLPPTHITTSSLYHRLARDGTNRDGGGTRAPPRSTINEGNFGEKGGVI